MKKNNEKPEVVEERIYDLNCYKCDVGLKVKSGQSVYMCPKCGAMFRVRVTERLVKDVSTVTVAEAYVTVDKNNATGAINTNTVVCK